MLHTNYRYAVLAFLLFSNTLVVVAQNTVQPKYNNSSVYTGIEVGSKGVKKFDVIVFDYAVVKFLDEAQEKDKKTRNVKALIDSFRLRIGEPERIVEVVDVMQEARLSHLGIVPDKRRFTTFLIDIGSGNTKGGFFPDGMNTENFKLFQLNWGTKSTYNETEKRCDGDMSMPNFSKNLSRVLMNAENADIIYAVNASGAYPLSDNIAVSGGIAWATATLMHPELIDNPVISITFDELVKFNEKLLKNFPALSADFLTSTIKNPEQKKQVMEEIKRVHKVFDQKSLMSGAGLLWKIMRQFESAFETKQFYLVKNGQVGWVSAYVDETISN